MTAILFPSANVLLLSNRARNSLAHSPFSFLRLLAVSQLVSQRFGHPHSQIPNVLGIPFSNYCSVLGIPRYPLGDAQIPSVLVIPSKKMLDFAGKSKTF